MHRSLRGIPQIGESEYTIQEFSVEACADCDIVFLCVSGTFSVEFGRELAKSSYVIDNSSAFRYHDDVPLLVPPVNAHAYRGERLIANPNCSSAIALMVLGPLQHAYGLESIIVSTYQAASGAGKPAMDELVVKTRQFNDYGQDDAGVNFEGYPINEISDIASILFKAKDGFYIFTIRANFEISSNKVRKILGSNKLRFASHEELEKVCFVVKGALPPLAGPLYNITHYLIYSFSGRLKSISGITFFR
jgi:aspartate-semialdehyde dehydrogenase